MAAFNFLAAKRQLRESHRTLSLLALAQAASKDIKTQLEAWEKDAD